MNQYIDISIPENQNEIAKKLLLILSIDNILEIFNFDYDIDKNKIKKDISKVNRLYYIEFCDNKNLEILDIYTIDKYNTSRFIDMRIKDGNNIQIDFRFKYTKKLKKYIIEILAKAINYYNHRSPNDITIDGASISNNFAQKLANDSDLESLLELHFIISYLDNHKNDYGKNKTDDFVDFINGVFYSISIYNESIKFEYNKNDIGNYIFVPKSEIGYSILLSIINKAIYKIKSPVL